MAELIPGGVAAFFTFGYVGYLWTYSFTWPLGIILAVYVLAISFALQRFEVFDVYIELPFAAELGTTVAWLVANASLLPPLVPRLAIYVQWTIETMGNDDFDSDIEGGVRVETYPRQAATVLGGVLVVSGAFTLAGVYGDNLTFVEQLIYGIPEVLLGLGLLVYGFYTLFASPRRADRADARYILYLYLYVVLPPAAYNLFLLVLAPFQIVPLWIALFTLTAIVVVAEIGTLGVRAEQPVIALEGDPRYARAERYPVRIIQRWVLVTMLPPLVIYTVCWGVESFVDDVTTGDSLGAAAAASVAMGVVTLFFGGLSSPTRANGYFVEREEPPDEDAGVIEQAARRQQPPPLPVVAPPRAVAELRRQATTGKHPPIIMRRGKNTPDTRGKRRAGVDL